MKEKRNWLNLILFPHPIITIFLSLLSFFLLFLVFLQNMEETPLAYFTYAFSAYSLTILVILIYNLSKRFKPFSFLSSTKVGKLLLNDRERRFFIFFALSIPLNFFYAIFKIIYGAIIHSSWMVNNGILYGLIMTMRLLIVLSRKNGKEDRASLISGVLLCLTAPLYCGLLYRMVFQSASPLYSGYVIYLAALYAFIKIGSAIYGLIKDRKTNSISILSAKILKTALALISIIFLESGMLNVFGNGTKEESAMLLISGTIVAILLLMGGILMIKKSIYSRHV